MCDRTVLLLSTGVPQRRPELNLFTYFKTQVNIRPTHTHIHSEAAMQGATCSGSKGTILSTPVEVELQLNKP